MSPGRRRCCCVEFHHTARFIAILAMITVQWYALLLSHAL